MTLDVRVRDLRPGDRLKYGRFGHIPARVLRTARATPEWPGDTRHRINVLMSTERTDIAVNWNASTTIRVEREEPKADAKDSD